MNKLLVLALATACSAAHAQTPAINPMPDGSRDMYVGLGAQSMPRYEGAESRKTRALPVLQVEWSNGIFVSGMTAGMHLSNRPGFEAGPLLAIQPGRDDGGRSAGVGGVDSLADQSFVLLPGRVMPKTSDNRLSGMDEIHTRLLGGGFFNYYLAPQWRLTSSALWGAGNDRHGAIAELGVQRLALDLAPHHSLSMSAGVSLVNRDYNQAFFGVNFSEATRSGNSQYDAAGGLKDVHVAARWNWALSPGWLVTTHVQAQRLLGSAKDSPLVERPTNLTVSTALAYRF
jgi:outer membrane scaffolding protein for murein synthesis (MipA/OmpV family)